MRSRTLLLLLVALATTACGGRQELVESYTPSPKNEPVALPVVEPAVPALRIELSGPLDESALRELGRVRGIAVAAPIVVGHVRAQHERRTHRLRVVGVDPSSFRSVAPAPTRDADFVWSALASGDAVVTPAAARRLRFDGPEELAIGTATLKVGAFASNGLPDLGDVLVDGRAVRAMRGSHELVIGLRPGTDPSEIRNALKRSLKGSDVKWHRLIPDARQSPKVPVQIGFASGDLVGTMHFRILKNGFIQPDPAWVSANIVSASVPILGYVTCHRAVVAQMAAALAEIEEQGLAKKIHRADYGGCFVPRFIDRDPGRSLSMHAFGLAFDLNVSENYLGTRGAMDERVVAIFERWGFEWGGRWTRPDPMHFELDRVISE